MNKIKSNEFFKYFYGNLPIDTRYTIFTFQKGLQQNKNSGKVDSHCSVAFSFDHRICQVDRFLVNYGVPYTINHDELTQDPILAFNHKTITDPYLKNKNTLNIIKDGKFSKNFFSLFLIELIIMKIKMREPNFQIKDIRVLAHLHETNLPRLESLKIEDKVLYDCGSSTYTGTKINIPTKFYNNQLIKSFNAYFPKNINCVPYKNDDLGEGLNFIKNNLNGKTFKNNYEFERQILEVNTALRRKAVKL